MVLALLRTDLNDKTNRTGAAGSGDVGGNPSSGLSYPVLLDSREAGSDSVDAALKR